MIFVSVVIFCDFNVWKTYSVDMKNSLNDYALV